MDPSAWRPGIRALVASPGFCWLSTQTVLVGGGGGVDRRCCEVGGGSRDNCEVDDGAGVMLVLGCLPSELQVLQRHPQSFHRGGRACRQREKDRPATNARQRLAAAEGSRASLHFRGASPNRLAAG